MVFLATSADLLNLHGKTWHTPIPYFQLPLGQQELIILLVLQLYNVQNLIHTSIPQPNFPVFSLVHLTSSQTGLLAFYFWDLLYTFLPFHIYSNYFLSLECFSLLPLFIKILPVCNLLSHEFCLIDHNTWKYLSFFLTPVAPNLYFSLKSYIYILHHIPLLYYLIYSSTF